MGNPVALTNFGFSLEISTAERRKIWSRILPPAPPELETCIHEYDLPLKIDDKERKYNGLVGYFESLDPKTNLLYYRNDFGNTKSMMTSILEPFPMLRGLRPFSIDIDPLKLLSETYVQCKMELVRKVGLLDPFVALHGYTLASHSSQGSSHPGGPSRLH